MGSSSRPPQSRRRTASQSTSSSSSYYSNSSSACSSVQDMPRHDASEFKFAKRAVRKIAERSVVFPEEAGGEDWFVPPDRPRDQSVGDRSGEGDGGAAGACGTTSDAGVRTPEAPARNGDQPSVSSLDLPDVPSLADETASTASLSSNDNNLSPFQSRSALGAEGRTSLIENLARLDVNGPMPPLRRRSPGYIEACHTLRSSGTSCNGGEARKSGSGEGGTVYSAPSKLGEACARVQEEVEEEKEHSSVPAVHERDVQYGSVLGTGGFCEVRLAQVREGRGGRRRRS